MRRRVSPQHDPQPGQALAIVRHQYRSVVAADEPPDVIARSRVSGGFSKNIGAGIAMKLVELIEQDAELLVVGFHGRTNLDRHGAPRAAHAASVVVAVSSYMSASHSNMVARRRVLPC